ncbi:MAG: DUF2059 domain-containing protein [Vitreimonas sp.]
MFRKFLISLALIALLPSATATAQAPPPAVTSANHDLARRYLLIGGGEETFLEGAYYGFRAVLEHAGIHASADKWRRIRDVLRREFASSSVIFTNELVAFYETHYSSDDFQSALAFYETEPGQHYVAASMAALLPLMVQLGAGGAPAPDPLPASAFDPARLAAARALSVILVARMTPLESEQMSRAGFDTARLADILARNLAGSLTTSELEAARVWAASAAAQRLEGASAERNEAFQLASLHASAAVNSSELREQVTGILREQPT